MNELKPCPFCGGEAKIHKSTECWGHGEYVGYAVVKCCKCFATGMKIYDREMPNNETMERLAREAWNRRTNDE